ncbi:hypothetical protein B595_0978 [Chlamydia psittaci 84/55]|nr:hypothetical protein B595_0978 [Chlamydia psittaci 84/55]
MVIDLSLTDIYPMEITVSLSSGNLLRFQYHTIHAGLKNYHLSQCTTVMQSRDCHIYDLRFPCHLLLSKL